MSNSIKISFLAWYKRLKLYSPTRKRSRPYSLRLDEIEKSSFIWKFFCDFFKKQVSSIKLKITTIDQKIKLQHQWNNQTIAQLIAYFEVLKKQWSELISNNLRASNLLLVLHEYLRKKIVRKNVNVSNRKIVKKTIRQMKVVETKSSQKQQIKLKSKFSKKHYANKRLKTNIANESQMIAAVIASSNQKRIRSAKNLSHITCYACNKIDHYKS